jgi:hypothetical protein
LAIDRLATSQVFPRTLPPPSQGIGHYARF